ncbi:MAG: hypothetical protein J5931_10560 [Prevotella sp.]|nr:hypothetical protein [Prevotella sp.]MBQ7426567.1 hypothetical protein [Prevotella sp.]
MQASEDYHAIVTALRGSGYFNGQWLATGTSKSGIASALYAYYSEKKGYNDMDLYVPFCAPFCERVDDPRIGQYQYLNTLTTMPEVREKLLAIDRAIVSKSDLSDYLVSKYKEENKGSIKEMQDAKYTEDQIVAKILANFVNVSRNNLFEKLTNIPIDTWKDYIPDPTDKSTLDFTRFFIEKSAAELMEYIQEHPKASTRAKTEAEMLIFYKDYPTYAARYSDAMTKDFINNFLPNTTKKMIFVYGENDPWTGGAIPDPTNPNIQKILVPNGGHNDLINNEQFCPKTTYQQIVTAIRQYIK